MKVNISIKISEMVRKKYVSFEYVIGEVLPMISNESSLLLPEFYVDDEIVEVDISEEIIKDLYNYFDAGWSISGIIQFLLVWGVLMEV